MGFVRVLFYLILFLLLIAFVVTAFLFLSSPFSNRRVDLEKDPSLIHTTDGKRVDLKFHQAPFVLKTSVQMTQLKLLTQLDKHLSEVKCRYWAVKHTLLAAVRHGQLLPWEDRVCIAILFDDLPKLVGLRHTLERSGDALLKQGKHGYYYCANNFSQYPCVEVSIMNVKDHEVSVCTPTNELGLCTFQDSYLRRAEIYPRDWVFPLRPSALNGTLQINVPNRAEECLKAFFGENWLSDPCWHASRLLHNDHARALGRRVLPTYL